MQGIWQPDVREEAADIESNTDFSAASSIHFILEEKKHDFFRPQPGPIKSFIEHLTGSFILELFFF